MHSWKNGATSLATCEGLISEALLGVLGIRDINVNKNRVTGYLKGKLKGYGIFRKKFWRGYQTSNLYLFFQYMILYFLFAFKIYIYNTIESHILLNIETTLTYEDVPLPPPPYTNTHKMNLIYNKPNNNNNLTIIY